MLTEQTRIEIGNKIRNFRVSHNLSQGEFAESIDISANHILLNDTAEANPNEVIIKILNNCTAEQLDNISNYITALRQLII